MFTRPAEPAAVQASIVREFGLPPGTDLLTFVPIATTANNDSDSGSQPEPIVNDFAPSDFAELCAEFLDFFNQGTRGMIGEWKITPDGARAEVQVRQDSGKDVLG
jgi:hypothetical protein